MFTAPKTTVMESISTCLWNVVWFRNLVHRLNVKHCIEWKQPRAESRQRYLLIPRISVTALLLGPLLSYWNKQIEICLLNNGFGGGLVTKSNLTCNPMDCSPPGSSVCGISLARILEWIALSFSRGSSQGLNPDLLHCRQILYQVARETPS